MEIIQGILLLTILIGVIVAQASILKEYIYKYSMMVAAIQCCFGQKGLDRVEELLQSYAEQQKALKEQEKQKKSGIFSAKKNAVMDQPENFNKPPVQPPNTREGGSVACKKEDKVMSEKYYELRNRGKEPTKLTMPELTAYCETNCRYDKLRQTCRLQAKQQGFVNCGVRYDGNN